MAHFAKLDENNIVVQVCVVNNEDIQNLEFPESEPVGQQFLTSIGFTGVWKQTSYNSKFRGRYAGCGWSYDPVSDCFIEPQSSLNEEI